MTAVNRAFTTSYQSAVVSKSIALSCTVFEIFDVEEFFVTLKSRLWATLPPHNHISIDTILYSIANLNLKWTLIRCSN